MGYGHKLVTDGTDNHLALWDLRPGEPWPHKAGTVSGSVKC